MTSKQIAICNSIIHSASAATAAVGAGLAQIPGSDNAVITPIQIAMIISIGKMAFGVSLSDIYARTTIAEATASLVGRGVSQLLVGWIPGAGNVINATTAAAITEAIGWFVVKEFDKGGGE